jgi:hypothetical protein
MSSRRERRCAWTTGSTIRLAALFALALALTGVGASGTVWGKFTSAPSNAGNQMTAASDWVAPAASASVIQKSEGGTPGYIRQGGGFRVYANVSDAGNPATGVASVTGNVSSVAAGQSAAPLSAGAFTVLGSSYGFGSGALTANASLAGGTYTYSVTSTDGAGNGRTQSGISVVVDNTVPSGSDAQTANHGSTVGRPEIGDTITLTYTEPIDPSSIVSGWSGLAATSVVVHVDDKVPTAGNNDALTVYDAANTAQLPLGSVNLGANNYVGANRTFGATGTPSTIAQSGSSFVVTLGTASGTTTTGSSSTMIWTPAAGATDRAGNRSTTTNVTESGAGDRDF